MRIAFDVSPLSHERTGVNNYIRGSLSGLAAASRASGHEVVAFAPTSPAGRRAIAEALDGIDVDLRLIALPGAHGWRTAWSVLGRPAVVTVPAFALRIAFGTEGAAMVQGGQRVLPARLLASGFKFSFREVEPALRHLLAPSEGSR